MLDLPNITLWGCVWSTRLDFIDRTFRVLRYCNKICRFGEVIFFSYLDPKISSSCGWKIVRIPNLSMKRWNVFVNRDVPKYIRTPYCLSVHEDGFIVDPTLWNPEFLNCDYIGAPWIDGVVGNAGFCLESQKMLQEKMKLPDDGGEMASDMYLCRKHRKRLESRGIKFADTKLAESFSTELYGDDRPSFGFHGREHSHRKMKLGWDMVTESEKIKSVAVVFPYVVDATSTTRQEFDDCARRFVATYKQFPPGIDHTLYIVCSNGPRDAVCEEIFKGMKVVYDQYNGLGWDIGCEQYMARKVPEDFIVSMTTRSYFHRAGWLKRFIEARNQFGEGLYGTTGSYEVSPHIRTAFYGVDTWIYREYPHTIDSRQKGFYFESEIWSFTKFVESLGYPCIMVTWDGCYTKPHWRTPKNIFRSGNQSNILAFDRHSLIYEQADRNTKDMLKKYADGTLRR